jgi:low temperature requirement protein LtrA
MRGIDVPERTEDFTADPVELFFDLAFVFAFSRLVLWFVEDHSWSGVGHGVLLFALIWLGWSQFTWTANAVSGNGRVVRLLFLFATIATVQLGAAVSTSYDAGGLYFALSLSVILLMGPATMVLGAEVGSAQFTAAARYSIPSVMAAVLLVVGALVEDRLRVIAWLLAIGVALAGTIAAGSQEWIVRPAHFAERHGLIVIVALGEVIVAVGLPAVEALADGDGLTTTTKTTLLAAAVLACLLWWSYFDRVLPALEHRHGGHGGVETGRYARDVYTYAHAMIVGGIILGAAAIEEIALHPSDPIPTSFRVMLTAGLGLSLVGVVIAVFRAFGAIARERLVAVLVGVAIVAATGNVAGWAVLILLDVLLLVMLLVEQIRVEGRFRFGLAEERPAAT